MFDLQFWFTVGRRGHSVSLFQHLWDVSNCVSRVWGSTCKISGVSRNVPDQSEYPGLAMKFRLDKDLQFHMFTGSQVPDLMPETFYDSVSLPVKYYRSGLLNLTYKL